MTDETMTKEEAAQTSTSAAPEASSAPADASARPARSGAAGGRRLEKNPRRKSRARTERPKSEFDQRMIGIRRVTRVVSGGRRFSFSVTMVAGNHKGAVGVGTGKATDTALAIEKAYRSAVKNKIQIPLTDTNSIAHDVESKYSSGRIIIYPAPGRGVVAGGAVRDVLELAGVRDVGAKILSRSKNKLNNAQAAIKALSKLRPARQKKATKQQGNNEASKS